MVPKYTVITNIVSPESITSQEANRYVGQSWEFFETKEQAESCYLRQHQTGNTVVIMRKYHHATDFSHLHCVLRENYLKSVPASGQPES